MIDIKQDSPEFEEDKHQFGPHEERAIISLIFDIPDFYPAIAQYLKPEFFEGFATRYVYTIVAEQYEKHEVVLSRELCRDMISHELTADDPIDEIFEVIDRKSDPREVPHVKERLLTWAKSKAYGMVYSEEAIEAHHDGDYTKLAEIIEEPQKIVEINKRGFWFFSEGDLDKLFVFNEQERLTTGFKRLDDILNDGGPTLKDTLCFMAPTNTGKSIVLCNTGAANYRRGKNVLHVTLEMTEEKTAQRYLGIFSDLWISKRFEQKDAMKNRVSAVKANSMIDDRENHLIIHEFPPDDVSIDAVHALIDNFRRVHGINIDVVIIDYLELLLSRRSDDNKNDYTRQKAVSTQLTRLAKKENVFVVTASQTNRSGAESQGNKDSLIGLDKVAESYGKTMPLDYIITLNQTRNEYMSGTEVNSGDGGKRSIPTLRFYVVKNRNGEKFKLITATVNYNTMTVKDIQL